MNRRNHITTPARTKTNVRRGSALLIVIGILALIAVLGAIYISIGQSDTQAARAVVQRGKNDSVALEVASQLAVPIGLDRHDTYLIPSSNGTGVNTQRSAREAWDYPYTDWSVRSIKNHADNNVSSVKDWELFTRSGRHELLFNLSGAGAADDPRVAYDPWLSSTEPEYLGPEDLTLAAPSGDNGRVFSGNRAEGFWLDRRDWWQISNLAPDGRFVNLFNLRPEKSPFGDAVGGYDARPTVGVYADPDTGISRAGMTSSLTLLKPLAANGVETSIQAFDPLSNGVWTPGADMPRVVPGVSGDDLLNTPAAWTMFQRYMFFPMNQEFIIRDRAGNVADWSSPDFPAYQYADADGDGMADSRWAELVDASDPNNIIELDGDPDYRVFFAARVMDLSALVNVNTAGDLLIAPTVDYPYGLSLTEVDLRRLLTMSDQGFEWAPENKMTGVPYVKGSWQASGQEEGLSLSNIDHPINTESGLGGDPVQVYKSAGGGLFDADGDPISGYYTLFPDYGATDLLTEASKSYANEVIGALSYDAIRIAIERETLLDSRFYGLISNSLAPAAEPDGRFRLIQGSNFSFEYDLIDEPDRVNASPVGNTTDSRLDDENERAARRLGYDQFVGRLDVSRARDRVASPADYGAALFGIADLGELLTYRGVNDPDVTSRLEQTVQGRAGDGNTLVRFTSRRLSPLLSNRPLDLDRFGHGDGRLRGSNGKPFPSVRGQVDAESMVLFGLSPRLRLTTYSGSAGLKPSLSATPGDALEELPAISSVINSADGLFSIFRSALVPFGRIGTNPVPNNWVDDVADLDPAMTAPDPSRTTNYGGGSGELALLIAAQMALNTKDMADTDSDPTAATVILDEGARMKLEQDAGENDGQAEDWLFPWWARPGFEDTTAASKFDAGAGNISGQSGSAGLTDDRRHARNIFGVEPQPFIVEATTIVVYTDAPITAGGDADFTNIPDPVLLNRGGLGEPGGIFDPGSISNITINTAERLWGGDGTGTGNPDLALELIAFKLTNPFNHDISLGKGLTWNDIDDRWEGWDYYIEHGGRFYLLGDYVEFDDSTTPLSNGSPSAGNGNGFLEAVDVAAPEQRYKSASIGAGESRVFYVIANNMVGNVDAVTNIVHDYYELDNHWSKIMTKYNEHPSSASVQDPMGTDGHPITGPAWEWINRQLRVDTNNPMRIKEFDPETGKLREVVDTQQGGKNWRDILEPADDLTALPPLPMPVQVTFDNPSRVKTNVVRLWRRMTTTGENDDPTTLPNIGKFNAVGNDLLADRLWGTPTGGGLTGAIDPLDAIAPISGRGSVVENTISLNEELPVSDSCAGFGNNKAYNRSTGEVLRNDNTGWTLALWGTIRRADAEKAPGHGQIPQWMLEIRDKTFFDTDTSSRNYVKTWSDAAPELVDVAEGTLDASEIATIECNDGGYKSLLTGLDIRPDREFAFSLRDLWNLRRDSVAYTIGELPGAVESADNNNDPTNPGGNTDWRMDPMARAKFKTTRKLGQNVAMNELGDYDLGELMPELYIDNSGFKRDNAIGTGKHSVARPGDLLLALGVGAVQAPNPNRDGTPNLDYDVDEEWITLAEMLAIALGYDVPKPHTGTDLPEHRIDDPYFGMVNQWIDLDGDGTVYPAADPDDWRYVLPNGRLALNDYVSFFDLDTDGVFTEPTLANVNDVRTGSGVPMAMDVVGRVRMHEPIEPLTDPNSDYLLTRVVPGLININTAPASTLRLLAGLSPSFDAYPDPTPTGTPVKAWWPAEQDPGTSSKLQNLSDVSRRPDIAASIVAYRDRLKPVWRRASDPNGDGATPPDASSIEFRFDPDPLAANQTDLASGNYTRDITRGYTTGIRGIRETPGFRSTGEVLAVTLAKTNRDGTPNANFDDYRHLSIQAYGLDEQASEVTALKGPTGASIGMAPIESDVYDTDKADDIVDDMGERLALANNVLGSISVSSDVYAVWYVVHGYRERDVSELRPGDPLVPSYARRFLMILDRSNVKTEQDAPRVVYFREVPM